MCSFKWFNFFNRKEINSFCSVILSLICDLKDNFNDNYY